MPARLSGLIGAAFTPLHEDGTIRLETIDRLCEAYLANGLGGVFVCGTTGECHSLSTDERRQVAARWIQAAAGRLPVAVHVGHNSLPDAIELAAHAAQAGAAAVSAMAPFFFKPESVEDLVDYCAVIAGAAGDLPFYFYEIPGMTGVALPMAEFLTLAAETIPTFAGLKYSNPDLVALQECVAAANGRQNLLFGFDELLLPGLVLGAEGAIGATYNFAAPVYHRILEAVRQGDLAAARSHQRTSVAMVRHLQDFGFVRAAKSVMAMLDLDCGPVRAPLRPLGDAEQRMLYESLRDLDVFPRPLRAP